MNNEEIAKSYLSGLTIREIAEKANVSYETIRKILKNQKIKWNRNYISDLTPDQVNDIIDRYVEKKETIKKIASWYEMSAPAISRLLKSKNINVKFIGRKYDILRQTPINNIQKQILVGSILGDGCLYKDSKNGNFKLSFGHCKAQSEYFHWKISMLDPFINTWRESIDKRKNSVMLQTATICHKDFNMFAKIFYDNNRIKHVPNNLDMFLTPLSLAIWVMDDGNLNNGVNMRIATMSFTKEENIILQSYLKRCFDLNSKVMEFKYKSKLYYQITLNKINTQKLSDLIRPYVVDCMKYKIMPESSTTLC